MVRAHPLWCVSEALNVLFFLCDLTGSRTTKMMKITYHVNLADESTWLVTALRQWADIDQLRTLALQSLSACEKCFLFTGLCVAAWTGHFPQCGQKSQLWPKKSGLLLTFVKVLGLVHQFHMFSQGVKKLCFCFASWTENSLWTVSRCSKKIELDAKEHES